MLNVKYYYKIFYMAMPSNIYYWWNFGSLLGVVLMSQIISGVFLSLFYENDIILAFDSISQISRNINFGWFIRSIHANGASMFFIFIYLHMSRSLYFKLFIVNKKTWVSGVMILLLLFMSAFIGYVLPWGQMSFWGATVITNLLSSMPYFGGSLTLWVWGGFSVSKPTLLRFFSFHFILPFILLLMVIIHIILLHEKGSSNPIGINSNLDKISFNPFFIWKDLMGVVIFLMIFITVSLIFPYIFMDPDNFIPANPLVTPVHIQPEWYFLFAYAILRTISNKLGGVLALFLSILMYFLILFYNEKKYNYLNQKFVFKMFFFFWICNFFYLTILGAQLIEPPYEFLSKICSMIYFLLFMLYI